MIVDDKLTLDLTTTDLGKVVEEGQPVQLSILYAYGKKQNIAIGLSNDPKTSTIGISLPSSDKENAGKPLEIIRASASPDSSAFSTRTSNQLSILFVRNCTETP